MMRLGFKPQDLLNFFQERNYFIYIIHKSGALQQVNDKNILEFVKERGYVDLLCTKNKP